MNGWIFDVKRFAVHDGPGIRTTLFLKGCPLNCFWCHNPEGIAAELQLAYYAKRCIQCGECARVCSSGAQTMTREGHVFDRKRCIACGKCAAVCLGEALRLFGREISVSEALELVLEDRAFYRDSGGVTLSGGEPLLQADFCSELLADLHDRGIHTAVDTCGEVPWVNIEQVLPYTDLFLYDIKQGDDAKHREGTGVGNERILKNLHRLAASGAAIEIRIPLIPKFNDAVQAIHKTGKILSALKGIAFVKLLPYHGYAQAKYTALGFADSLLDLSAPHEGDLAAAAEILKGYGLMVSY